MKFALVGSALAFAVTTLAGGPPPSYGGEQQQNSPQNGGGIASPVGQGSNGAPAPADYGQQQNSPQQHGSHQGSGQPKQNGGGIASPVNIGGSYPGGNNCRPPASHGQGGGQPKQNGNMVSPVGQGQNGRPAPAGYGQEQHSPQQGGPQGSGHPKQNGGGIASPVGQGQNGSPAQAGYDQQQRQAGNGGQGHPNDHRGPAMVSPVEGSGKGQNGDRHGQPQKQPGGNHGHPDSNRGPAMVSPVGGSGKHDGGSPTPYGRHQKSPGGSQGHAKKKQGPAMVSPVGGNGHNMSGPQCCIESSFGSHGSAQSAGGQQGQHQQSPQQQSQGQPYQGGNGQMQQCITPQEGQDWLDRFISVLGHTGSNIEQTANEIIADQYIEVSNSILSLQHKPLSSEGIAAPNKQAWIKGVTNAPSPQGIQTKDVVFGCDKLVWYWSFDKVGAGRYQQNGFNLFHFVRNGGRLQAHRLDLEFDSIAWGLNTGSLSEIEYADGTEVEGVQETEDGPSGAGEQAEEQ